MATHETAQSLASKDVDAIGAWQPNAGEALKAVAGAKSVFTSADAPGLIYDLLSVNPKSLAERRADWVKVVKVWNRIVKLRDGSVATKTRWSRSWQGAPASIRPKITPTFLPGTSFLSPEEALARFEQKDGLESALRKRQSRRRFQRGQQGLCRAAARRRVHRFILGERGARKIGHPSHPHGSAPATSEVT